MKSFKPGAAVALFLSTSAFAVSFAVWGLIGALPPLILGVLRDATGAYTWGFIFLAVFALGCLAVNYFVFLKPVRNNSDELINQHAY